MMKAISAGLGAVGRALPVLLRDLIGLVGVGSIAYGAWLIQPAAGFIAGGVLLVAGALLAALAARD